MTVGELIAELQKEDPDRIVVMSSDAEGNRHSPLASFWTGAYRPETTWMGEVGLQKLTKQDREDGYTNEDVIRDGQPAVILSPVC